ncbi:DUF4397 domain-containing protein [Peribacillus sp. SCS-37]|uniref:DUF4397 domain-containing protein n=1 Tax=Paraperibacillus esterisolvens TaxID=3115296 RepID=UPI0039058FCF
MEKRSSEEYFQKASKYAMLAKYYEYTNPELHAQYYSKHIRNLERAIMDERLEAERRQTPASVRVIHAAPDTGEVDIYINGMRALRNVPYKQASDYLPLPAGKYQIDIYPAGTMVSTAISRKVTVEGGQFYTLTAAGAAPNLKLLTAVDNLQLPVGETKVRFAHLSPDAPPVDIAVKNGDVIFPNVSFRKFTDYITLSPMTVDLEVRLAGTSDVVLAVPGVRLDPNIPYTILALGFAKGTPELEAMLVNP